MSSVVLLELFPSERQKYYGFENPTREYSRWRLLQKYGETYEGSTLMEG